MKILFFHNTIPDYRIPFFIKISKKADIKFAFTSIHLSKNIYGNEINKTALKKINYIALSPGFKALKEIKNEFYTNDPDIVVIQPLDNIKEIVKGYYIYMLCKQSNKKILYFWEKWEAPKNKQSFKRKIKEFMLKILIKPILRNVDLCLAPGKKTKEYFLKLGIKENNIMHIHNSSEATVCNFFNIKDKYLIPKEKSIILYYGRITKKKGLDNLLKAYSNLSDELRNKSFIIVAGDGDFKSECKKLAQDLKIKNIKFAGYVNPNNRYTFFSQSDIFVLPGRVLNGSVEAWGLTLNEALQFNKILISTTSVGAAYELITKDNGFMVKENNIQELSQAIAKAIYLCSCSNCIENSIDKYNKVFQEYNYKNMSDDFVNAANKLMHL